MNVGARDVLCVGRTFQHEALFYTCPDDFVAGAVPFVREGINNDEPILVIVDAPKIGALRAELGADADGLCFADMADVGRNPARVIPRWQRFLDERVLAGRPSRGIGEAIWAGRSPAELVECQAHETLLNVAFADSGPWMLLCPYDIEALEPCVIEEARRSHPVIRTHDASQVSDDYLYEHPSPARLTEPLEPAPDGTVETPFGPGFEALKAVRSLVSHFARQAGFDITAANQLVLAANELATNSLRHGGGQGTIRLWRDGHTLICEINDAGRLRGQPLLGRQRPGPGQIDGRGLWLANQLCDLVQIRSTAAGTTVRVQLARS